MNEIEKLKAELAEQEKLAAKIAEEKAALAQRIKLLEEAEPTKISLDLIGAMISIRFHKYHHQLIEYLKQVPGRRYDGTYNTVPVECYPKLIEECKSYDNIVISYNSDSYRRIDEWLNKPDYHVELDQRNEFIIELGPKVTTLLIIEQLKGLRNNGTKFKSFKLGAQEGVKLGNFLREVYTRFRIVVTPEAQALIEQSTLDADKLARIAAQETSDIVLQDFNGQTLKPFQAVGVEYALEAKRFIIGDEMGLGKSPQSIAHAVMLQRMHPEQVIRSCWIVPSNLILNWVRAIEKFAGEIPTIFAGSIPTQHDYADFLIKKPKMVLISYDTINRPVQIEGKIPDKDGNPIIEDFFPWINLINISGFTNIYLDEAHYIKNITSNRSRACRLLSAENIGCLTGTPVQNRPAELWPMLNLLKPDEFKNHEGFIKTYSDGGNGVRNVAELRDILKNVMIRRRKKDVQKELPLVNRINEYVELSAKAKKVYNRALRDVYESISTGKEMDITNMLVKIMRLKQITSISKYEYVIDLADRLRESHDTEDNPYNKVLIFSQFIPTVKKIAQNMECDYIVGMPEMSVNDRQRVIDDFQANPKKKYLVCSTGSVQEGFDITAAGYTIFVDLLWTPAGHQQCEGRAYGRLNDPHGIDSYYVLGKKTVDENIYGLLLEKMTVIEATVDGEGGDSNTSIMRELIRELRDVGFTPLE